MKKNYFVLIFIILVVITITYLNRPKETFSSLEEYKKSRIPQKFDVGIPSEETMETHCDNIINRSSQIKKMEEEVCNKNPSEIDDIINKRYECNDMSNKDIYENINKNSWCENTNSNPIVQKANEVAKPYNSVKSLNNFIQTPNPNGYGKVNNNFPFNMENSNLEMKNIIDNLNNKIDKPLEINKIKGLDKTNKFVKY